MPPTHWADGTFHITLHNEASLFAHEETHITKYILIINAGMVHLISKQLSSVFKQAVGVVHLIHPPFKMPPTYWADATFDLKLSQCALLT